MKGLKVFLVITSISLLAIIVAFIFFYFIWIGKVGNPLTQTDKVQALTSILALFLGTAAALGSAIAALKVASLGLEISHQQERRDSLAFVDAKSEKCIDLFSEIALTLGDLHASVVALNAAIPVFPKEHTSKMMNEPLDETLSLRVHQLCDHISSLSALLKQVMKNETSKSCFQQTLKTFGQRCEFINQNLKNIDFDVSRHSIYSVSLNNLSDVASILDLAQRRLQQSKLGEFIQARLFANSSEIPMFNVPYDNANVRNFMFLGNLLLSITNTEKHPFFIANYGAAILHDLFFALSDGKMIASNLKQRYSSFFLGQQPFEIDFEPQNIVSFYFFDALVQANLIGELYLLIEKKGDKPTH